MLDYNPSTEDATVIPMSDKSYLDEKQIECTAAMIAGSVQGASGDPADLSSAIKRRDKGG